MREAARAGAAIAAEHAPRLGRVLDAQLGAPATASPASLRTATALTNRILRFVERRRR